MISFYRSAGVLIAAAMAFAPDGVSAQAVEAPEANLSVMTTGYTYYNRPGADLRIHDAEVADCAAEGARTISLDEQIGNGANQGVLGALIGGALQDAYHRGAAASGLENCMVVRGWRVVRLADEEGKLIAKLAPADLSARLAPWVGAEAPHGQIVRIWANDAANAAHNRFATRPGHSNDGQLSLTEATSGNLHQFKTLGKPAPVARNVIDRRWPKRALTADTLGTVPAGSAILVFQVKDVSLSNGQGVVFSRAGTEMDISPSRSDHAPDLLIGAKSALVAHKEGDMFAFAVPPGHWRVAGLQRGAANGSPLNLLLQSDAGMLVLNFCLGAPAFDVKAGEVVYAGSFDLSGADLGPDLDLAPAKAWLAGRPQADALRAATYVNGSRGLCANNAIYALEVKGAPFEAGYVWGGALPPPDSNKQVTTVVANLPAAAAASPN